MTEAAVVRLERSTNGMHPPRAPLALRVGVAGHRPDPDTRPLPDASLMRATIVNVLEIVRQAVDAVASASGDLFALSPDVGGAPVARRLRLVSALAAGPDQWVAREAIALGYELQAVLPFEWQEYREDFRTDGGCCASREADRDHRGESASPEAEYLRLLDVATATFALDGKMERSHVARRPDGRTYEAAGRTILRQSDLLIAVWDGQQARGPGGTGQMVDEALARGIPVVWIHWEQPQTWQLLLPAWREIKDPDVSPPDAHLARLIRGTLLPPDTSDGGTGGDDLRAEYFKEDQKRGNPLLGCWALLRSFACGEFLRPEGWKELRTLKMFRVEPFLSSEQNRAARGRATETATTEAPIGDRVASGARAFADTAFLPHYAWANGLSMYYGDLHRSAFLLNSLLGAAAVFLALVTLAAGIAGTAETPWILAELLIILAIVGLTRVGRRRRWHQRWIDYRMLAERLRVARCASLLGGDNALVLHAAHLASYGNPLRTWMHWHYQAIERAAGLVPAGSVTPGYLAACRETWVQSLVEDQHAYHRVTGERLAKIDRRLHRAGNSLFVLTLVVCLLRVGYVWIEGTAHAAGIPHWVPGWLTLLCAFLPATGAALAAIRSHGETLRLAQRSRAMHDALGKLWADLEALPTEGDALNFVRLRDCVDRVADLMIRELLDWRVVFQDRPLNLPV